MSERVDTLVQIAQRRVAGQVVDDKWLQVAKNNLNKNKN
jgi:hypothetical protein